MTRRLEHRSPTEAWWVRDLADGRQERVGPLTGYELRKAHAELDAEREVEAARAALAEQARRAAVPPPPHHDAGRPTPRMHERPMNALDQPVNSTVPDRVRSGMVTDAHAAALRRAITHYELD